MASYELFLERILCAVIEISRDDNGMILPPSIAPFDVVVTPVNVADTALSSAALRIYEQRRKAGFDPLLDDRDERPGVKFKDADLIGIPFRITVGKKIAQGIVEVMERRTKSTEEVEEGQAAALIAAKLCPSGT
jgi:prolyl-tRNA synthetase